MAFLRSSSKALHLSGIKYITVSDSLSHRLMSHDSKQTKEYACRALRQMCVEESIRGQVVQQGGLKACIAVVNDEEVEVRVQANTPAIVTHSQQTKPALFTLSKCHVLNT